MKDYMLRVRMSLATLDKLERIVMHLAQTKLSEEWDRSSTVRHLIDRFYDNLPESAKTEETS